MLLSSLFEAARQGMRSTKRAVRYEVVEQVIKWAQRDGRVLLCISSGAPEMQAISYHHAISNWYSLAAPKDRHHHRNQYVFSCRD
jgi:hypothetical protein